MAVNSPPDNVSPTLALDKIYGEIRTAIRDTDNISFKLLGLVPLVSGTALTGLVIQTASLPANVVMLLALFGAAITLGLFRWELRNVQTCSWLIKYADAMEGKALEATGIRETFHARPTPPQRIGKTEAEKLIYTITVLAWVALPLGMGTVPPWPSGAAYYVVMSVIVIVTIISVFANARVPETRSAGGNRE